MYSKGSRIPDVLFSVPVKIIMEDKGMNKKSIFKASSILWALVFALLLWRPVEAAQETEQNSEHQAESIGYYTRHDEVFTGEYTVSTELGGYDTLTITVVMDIGYYYEEGVYAEIVYYVPHSQSAYIASTGHASVNIWRDYEVSDGNVSAIFEVNDKRYAMVMWLDDWGEPVATLVKFPFI